MDPSSRESAVNRWARQHGLVIDPPSRGTQYVCAESEAAYYRLLVGASGSLSSQLILRSDTCELIVQEPKLAGWPLVTLGQQPGTPLTLDALTSWLELSRLIQPAFSPPPSPTQVWLGGGLTLRHSFAL